MTITSVISPYLEKYSLRPSRFAINKKKKRKGECAGRVRQVPFTPHAARDKVACVCLKIIINMNSKNSALMPTMLLANLCVCRRSSAEPT